MCWFVNIFPTISPVFKCCIFSEIISIPIGAMRGRGSYFKGGENVRKETRTLLVRGARLWSQNCHVFDEFHGPVPYGHTWRCNQSGFKTDTSKYHREDPDHGGWKESGENNRYTLKSSRHRYRSKKTVNLSEAIDGRKLSGHKIKNNHFTVDSVIAAGM